LVNLHKESTSFLFVSSLNEALFQAEENWKKIVIPFHLDNRLLRPFREQFVIPYYARKYKIDILFSSGNVTTLFPGCHQVLTVQGSLVIRKLRQQYAPREIPKLQALYYDLMLPLSVKRADRVIAVSQDIKQWLLQQVDIPASKVTVIYEGVDRDLFHPETRTEISNTNQPFILFVSTLFRYKNADKLIQAFSVLKRTHKIPHNLVIVGRDPDDQMDRLKKLAKDSGSMNSVHFMGKIPYEEVNNLHRNADVFVHPSTLESFGLPVLEAMACGAPVIGSNRCSVPEIIGDAGLIVDPDDIEELAKAIYRVLTDQELRERLIQKGYERVKMFTWEKAAEEMLKVFKEIYQERRHDQRQ
ncbi:MAG: glycosyltransferase family 4 protein, partial [Candidatus Bipolaricaulia bacterium]